MKRSRIFLGLTTAFLAIAGVVAAKATHFDGIRRLYITSNGACVLQPAVQAPCICVPDGVYYCVTALSGNPYFLYTQVVLGHCIHPVTYDLME